MLGKPSVDDTAYLQDKQSVEYVREVIDQVKKSKKQDVFTSTLRETYAPIKNKGLVDLLETMLQFNPDFRLTAKELLKHSIFDKVRK